MAQEFLDRSDVVAVLEEVGCEGVPESVTGGLEFGLARFERISTRMVRDETADPATEDSTTSSGTGISFRSGPMRVPSGRSTTLGWRMFSSSMNTSTGESTARAPGS